MTTYDDLQTYGIKTYGYDVTVVTKYISDDMKTKFAKATEDLSDPVNRALVQACYSILMQMKSVSSTGELMLDDGAIESTQKMILEEEANKG